MSCSACGPAGPAAAPFWEMLALLAREPGMEWLELGLAGQAATSRRGQGAACGTEAVALPGGPGQRGAAVAGRCGPCSAAGLPTRAAAQRLHPRRGRGLVSGSGWGVSESPAAVAPAGQAFLGFARGFVQGRSFWKEASREFPFLGLCCVPLAVVTSVSHTGKVWV